MIREATHADIPGAEELLRRMHAESQYRDEPYSVECVERFLKMHIERDTGLMLVADEGGIVGVFLGHLATRWFNGLTVAEDSILYVAPEKRGGLTAVRLSKKYREWAKEKGAFEAIQMTGSGINQERATRFFEACGFEQFGIMLRAKL